MYRVLFEVSGFRREVDNNCALLGYCAVSSSNSLLTFRDSYTLPANRF